MTRELLKFVRTCEKLHALAPDKDMSDIFALAEDLLTTTRRDRSLAKPARPRASKAKAADAA